VAQLCVTVEVVVCSVPLINYARRLCKLHAELHRESHKAKRGQAPGRGGTRMLTSAMDAEYGEYFKIDAYASDVVEKQADYIEVLQTHKQRLAAEINMLANELKYLRCPDGTSSASVNSTGRMAQQGAGEPELRMVQVERDDLQRRLESMTREIQEKECMVQQVQASLGKEGEHNSNLLLAVEDMRTELLIQAEKLRITTEERDQLKSTVKEMKHKRSSMFEDPRRSGARVSQHSQASSFTPTQTRQSYYDSARSSHCDSARNSQHDPYS